MSRAYEIAVSRSQRRHIVVEEGVRVELDILGVLPPERTRELLRARLRRSGLAERPDGSFEQKLDESTKLVVDPSSATATVRSVRNEDVHVHGHKARRVAEEARDGAEAALEADVALQLDQATRAHEKRLRQDVSQGLERKLIDLQAQLDKLSNDVSADALEEHARSLGEITQIERDETTGELTIRLKV